MQRNSDTTDVVEAFGRRTRDVVSYSRRNGNRVSCYDATAFDNNNAGVALVRQTFPAEGLTGYYPEHSDLH
jgi:hypothetical protein